MKPEENFHSIVMRLQVTNYTGKIGCGTGFLYCNEHFTDTGEPYRSFFIITNKHVVREGISLTFYMSLIQNPTEKCTMVVPNLQNKIIGHPEEEIDLCAINITDIFVECLNKQIKVDWQWLNQNIIMDYSSAQMIKAIEETFMVGYPNGLSDEVNGKPLIRKGITATNASIRFNGEKKFLIDLPCFPGSSGSPVFIIDDHYKDKDGTIHFGMSRTLLIGVVQGAFQSSDSRFLGQNLGLGVVINYEAIYELVELLKVTQVSPLYNFA